MRATLQRRRSLKVFTGVVVTLLALGLSLVGNQGTAHASGSPPDHVIPAPSGGVDTLHGAHPGLKHGVKRITTRRRGPDGMVTTASTIVGTDPIIMVHGIWAGSTTPRSCTTGNFGNTRAYLQNGHSGLSGDTVYWTGSVYLVGIYNADTDCDTWISTNNNPHGNYTAASRCNGVSTQEAWTISNSDSSVGTTNEPIEHISCELSWYIYSWSSIGQNVKILAHSMGGLIVRYMIEQVQHGDTHFAPYLYVSDVVTFSTPHGGITSNQTSGVWFACGLCYQGKEMEFDNSSGIRSAFMVDLTNRDHPDASGGTDWTMLGSLGKDPLDWDYQATDMSNSGGLSNNHRIGYTYPFYCNGVQQPWSYVGYDHGDYMNDQCDYFDAIYYYCDGCLGSKHTNFSKSFSTPHSLHEMLFAFVYANW